MMSDKLTWTQKLGDAVLAQQADVMDAIQRLRAKAQANNKLQDTKEQKVTRRTEQNKQVIVIEPTNPNTIYVPYYDPAVVYGPSPYPAYPPYYWPPRRIGRNELAAIQACLTYFDAQNEYADMNRSRDGMAVYAQRIVSSPGKKDGLYWPTSGNEPQSPLGESVADATQQGYRVGAGEPFHGYYYRILTRQGPTAPGGAVDYVVKGDMIGGFALVTYPAEYGNSGIMTFIINNDGDVYQKDLGERTKRIASRMILFNPDHTWKKVVDVQVQK